MMEDEVAALVVDNGSGKVRQLSDYQKHFFRAKNRENKKESSFSSESCYCAKIGFR